MGRSWLKAKFPDAPSHRGLLALVIILGVLILLGMVALILGAGIAGRQSQHGGRFLRPPPFVAPGERVESTQLDGNRILLRLVGPERRGIGGPRNNLGACPRPYRGLTQSRGRRAFFISRTHWRRRFCWATARAYPSECCGLIEGLDTDSGWRALSLHETANIAPGSIAAFYNRSAEPVRTDAGAQRV